MTSANKRFAAHGEPPQITLQTIALTKHYGGIAATDNVNLDIERGRLHALIGPNGAGKTTLIAQLSGLLAPDSGQVLLDGNTITSMSCPARVQRGLTRTFQITSIFKPMSVLDNVALAVQANAGHSFRFWKPVARDASLREPAMHLLELLRLQDKAHVLADELSHGEQRQLEIAMALATQPKVLMLDEPMAGMGGDETARLTHLLLELKQQVTILLVEHDMDAVFALADRLSVLVSGKLIATGELEEVRSHPAVIEAYLGDAP